MNGTGTVPTTFNKEDIRMKEQMKRIFQRMEPIIWIAVVVLFIGIAPQLRADEHAAPNESGWVQTNGPYGGEILTFYVAPKGVLFAGTEGGGIFRSTDRGNSWTPINTGLLYEPGEGFTGVPALVQKGETLYAGTRDTLYASTDGGNTWHRVSTFQKHESISGIVVIGERIYVGTLNTGVWYSDDDGDSWLQVNDGFGPMSIHELSRIGTTLVAGAGDRVFRKRDNADELNAVHVDFVLEQIDAFAAMENLLYVGGSVRNGGGLFRSNDEGDSWTGIAVKEMRHTVEALAVFGATLYAGTYGSGVFRSDDKGNSWTAVNTGLTDRTVSTLLVVNEDTVFAGTSEGGVFRTMDGGNSWVDINTGLTNAMVSELEVVGDRIYAQTGKRIFHSVDGGASWQPVRLPSMTIKYEFPSLSVSDGELYVGAVRYATPNEGVDLGGIFRLDAENNTLVELITHRDLAGLQCIEVVGTTFYIGALVNGVSQWKKDSGPWIINLGLKGYYINMLLTNGKRVYASVNSGEGKGDEIYRLQGEQWEPIQATGMMNDSMSDLRWVGSTLYATFLNGGVFRSVNGGNSWTSINDGLNGAFATSIGTDGTELYVGTVTGVFQWIAAKEQWEPVGSLLDQILSLAVLDGFLYAGTAYNGVFKIRIEK